MPSNATSRRSMYFVVDDELRDRIDAQAAAMGVTRASFLRMLVQLGMGEPSHIIVMRETYYRLQPVMGRILARAIAHTNAALPDIINEEIDVVAHTARER